ncbi:basic salivary proline-rich protein 3-like [Corythoichthys intestinalis]|uniref:basic salivary proline-rich protein 3-like n=1 Tax=Corythoichthys intestinalis TaxID=161448 RepID=UPI0025A545B3|nr:basic salivary proline-rich protein 3-like [Corythoichthys intestinalis]
MNAVPPPSFKSSPRSLASPQQPATEHRQIPRQRREEKTEAGEHRGATRDLSPDFPPIPRQAAQAEGRPCPGSHAKEKKWATPNAGDQGTSTTPASDNKPNPRPVGPKRPRRRPWRQEDSGSRRGGMRYDTREHLPGTRYKETQLRPGQPGRELWQPHTPSTPNPTPPHPSWPGKGPQPRGGTRVASPFAHETTACPTGPTHDQMQPDKPKPKTPGPGPAMGQHRAGHQQTPPVKLTECHNIFEQVREGQAFSLGWMSLKMEFHAEIHLPAEKQP